MQNNLNTNRLLLDPIGLSDADFVLELVNLPDWVKYIGERQVHSLEAAKDYISKMTNNSKIKYWVVKLKEDRTAIGVVTFIKRDYLQHHDVGFAFLPNYRKQGYAYEATVAVIDDVKRNRLSHTHILATALEDNVKSIKLLEKLGFQFDTEIWVEDAGLLLYSLAIDKPRLEV
ncbi:GNAT family N-acetyltransferase [Nafulsella turpanensis]|uniref:GNAT family N-acetyltransferase n=1 Tax=Nafulsella turpanensis TaxID=1265690 RepID=UPI00036B4256|nr:GNAT family N-acetyltransferase [Nafulsella turpanensis]